MTSNSSDDYIGTESCIDLQNDIVVVDHYEISKTNNAASLKSNSKRKEKRVFPPPISHMPWVMKRHYTSDGRLMILTQEKVNHHQYFRVHRSNGRLTLHLVPLHHQEKEEEVAAAAATDPHENYDTHQNVKTIGYTVTGVSGGSSSKRLNCYRVRSSASCIFGVPLHPVRTVQG